MERLSAGMGLVSPKELVRDWVQPGSKIMSFEADFRVSAVACRGDYSSLISRSRRYRWRACLRELCSLGLSLVAFHFAAWAQQSFELSARAEFETSFLECGESAYQQYTYSGGPGVGGLPGGSSVCLGVKGEPRETSYLDNLSIALLPSGPVTGEVQIESLRKDGWLTWRSSLAPGYYGLECTEDLSGEWRPSAFWNLPLAGTETSVQIPLRPSSASKLFFRVVCSQHELPLPRGAGAWEPRTDRGTVRGKVTFWEGNFMPPSTGTITPVRRPIFVFEKARRAQTIQSASGVCFYSFVLSRFVDSTESGADGAYEIALPPGDYSLLVLERAGDFYVNLFDGTGGLNPVTVQANQTVAKDIPITYKASF